MMEGWKEYKIKDYPINVIDGDRGNNYPKKSELFDKGYRIFLNTGNVTSSQKYRLLFKPALPKA